MLLTEQTAIQSGDRYENMHIQIAPDIAYKNIGGGIFMALDRVDDVVFRNVVIESPWTLPEQAPFYADMIQLHRGGNGLRFENVTILGAPRIGLSVRGATDGIVIRNLSGERCFSLLGLYEGPHRCARIQNISGKNGWICGEKQPAYDNGKSQLVEGRRNGWSLASLSGIQVGVIEHITSWGEMAGLKVTHCKNVDVKHFSIPSLMVQESKNITVQDGVVDRNLAATTTRPFNGVQLSHPSKNVTIENVRVHNDGRAKNAFQVAHGMQAEVDHCQVFGWAEDAVRSVYDDISTIEWGAGNQVFTP